MRYSQERRQAVPAKLAPPHKRTVREVAAREGISEATLYNWRRQARLDGALFPDAGADPEGWNAREKFIAVIETATLRVSPNVPSTVAGVGCTLLADHRLAKGL